MVSKFVPGVGDYHTFGEDEQAGKVVYDSFYADADRSKS